MDISLLGHNVSVVTSKNVDVMVQKAASGQKMKTHKPGRVCQLGANEMAGSGQMEGLHPRSMCLYNKTADQLVSLTEIHIV